MKNNIFSTTPARTSGPLGLISVPAVIISAEAVKNDPAARAAFLAGLALEITEARAAAAAAMRRFNRVNTVAAGNAVNRAEAKVSILERAARIA